MPQQKNSKMSIMNRRTRNPRNPLSGLFRRLTRLFSGPIVNYRHQTARSLRDKNIDKYGKKFRSTSGQEFRRSEYNPFNALTTALMVNHQRAMRYSDFSQMEFNPDLAAVLDLYGDEMTVSSYLSPLLRIRCSNEEIREVLHLLYFNILNLDFNLHGYCRNLCKYGDFILYLDIDEEKGVKNVIPLPIEEIERIEGEDANNPNYYQMQWNAGQMTFEAWQVAHFRILGNDKYAPYGTSILDPARRVWRQLDLMENAMLAYRVVRAPERRAWYVDVGNIDPNDVETYMQKIITTMKRNSITDPSTGEMDLRYNPMSIEDDFYIPVRGGNSSRVEPLPGGQFVGDIDDVKYLRDKLFSALKVPMSYISRGEAGTEDKESLAAKDLRFARTIQRLQRCVTAELEKIGIIHLYILGFRGEDLLSFSLSLNNPSKIAELQELEHWRTKFDVASSATEGFFSRRWISDRLFNMSDEEFLRNQREMYFDKYMDSQFESLQGEDKKLGGDLGEKDLSVAPELASTKTDKEEAEQNILLAKPDETELQERKEGYLTPGAKGKVYYPATTDTRNMGARNRSMKSKYSDEMASSADRNIHKGLSGIESLLKEIKGNNETIYIDEERSILKTDEEVKILLECLGPAKETGKILKSKHKASEIIKKIEGRKIIKNE